MGAKTAILVYADGDIPSALRSAGLPDPDETTAFVRRVRPDWPLEVIEENTLGDGSYPPGLRRVRRSVPWR